MNRTLYLCTVALLFVSAVAVAQDDLAAAARQARAQKKQAPATKVWTNDDFAAKPEPAPEAAPADDKAGAKDAAAKTADATKKGPSADDKAKLAAEFQKKIDSEKAEIATLQREYDIADREFKLQVATYYADAGNSLRDPQKWAQERDAKEKEIAGKKTAIDEAKAKLDDLVEQARKAGVNVNQ